jgi:hypothetical protein
MPQALVDVALGHGFSAQIFSGSLHVAGRSQLVIQFRVRDTHRSRVWTFRVQLTDEISDGDDGPRAQPFLSAARHGRYEQARFEADSLAEQTRDALSTILTNALQPEAVGAPRPPIARPPAHLVRPGLRPRPPRPLSTPPSRPGERARPPMPLSTPRSGPGLRPQLPVRPGVPPSALPRERSRSRDTGREHVDTSISSSRGTGGSATFSLTGAERFTGYQDGEAGYIDPAARAFQAGRMREENAITREARLRREVLASAGEGASKGSGG